MMTKIITIALSILVLTGCASTKEIAKLKENNDRLEKRIVELETLKNDSDKDGIADYLDVENNSIAGTAVDNKGRMIDLNKNGIADDIEKFILENTVDMVNNNAGAGEYKPADLYSLKPTKQKTYDHFFNNKMSLLECNNKLTNKLASNEALKDYKYFETDGGFGIITDAKEINENSEKYGSQESNSNFVKKLLGMGSATQNYQRVYIFLIIKKDLNEELLPNYDYLDRLYNKRVLQPKWANIENLKLLLSNPNNKYNNQEHTFVVRVYEFKRGQVQDKYTFNKGDNGYKIDPKVNALFTNKKPKK